MIRLKKGDMTLFYTDGITECRNAAGEEYTEERLIKLLKKYRKVSAETLMDKVFEGVDAHTSGVGQFDDMTLVVVKRVN